MGLLPEILFLLVIIISWIELSHFCSTFHQAQSIESGELASCVILWFAIISHFALRSAQSYQAYYDRIQ